jgi:hypothetical protein
VTRALAVAALGLIGGSCAATASSDPTLLVKLDDRMKARPVEGYVWFAGIDRAQRVSARSLSATATGRHDVVSYIRACDGNCGLLDPPSKRCRRTLTLRVGSTLHATVRLLDAGCRILLR